MRRILIALGLIAVVIVGWFAFKDRLYAASLGTGEREAEAPDYSLEEAWLARPGELPEGGWASPWGVDLLVLAPMPTAPAPAGLLTASSDIMQAEYQRFIEESGLRPEDLVVYTPSFRAPSPASGRRFRESAAGLASEDISRAVARYLASDNRQRGLILFASPGSEPLLEAALSSLPEDEAFRTRFGGLVVSADMDPADWGDRTGTCSGAFETCVAASGVTASRRMRRIFLPNLPRPRLVHSDDGESTDLIERRASELSDWLEANATKPAEPFDTWAAEEVVDVAPIRRPNSERDISGERDD